MATGSIGRLFQLPSLDGQKNLSRIKIRGGRYVARKSGMLATFVSLKAALDASSSPASSTDLQQQAVSAQSICKVFHSIRALSSRNGGGSLFEQRGSRYESGLCNTQWKDMYL